MPRIPTARNGWSNASWMPRISALICNPLSPRKCWKAARRLITSEPWAKRGSVLKQKRQFVGRAHLAYFTAVPEQPGPFAQQFQGGAAQLQRAAFRQTQYGGGRVGQQKFGNTLTARLAHVAGRRVIRVMRIDLAGKQSQRGKRRRLDNRHVVGGANRRAGNVGTDAPAQIRHTGHQPRASRAH